MKFGLTDTNPASSKTKLETLRVRIKFKGDVEVIKVEKNDRDEGGRARKWERPRMMMRALSGWGCLGRSKKSQKSQKKTKSS